MKKLIALLLALVMVMAMVACGNTNAPAKETEAPKADAPAKETEAPKADETEAPAEEEPTVITIGIQKKDTVEDYDTNWLTQTIEEACNVDLEFVFFSADNAEFGTQFGLMCTNNEELPDIVFGSPTGGNSTFHNEYGAMEYFIDLTPYLTDAEKTPYWHESLSNAQDGAFDFVRQMSVSPIDGKWYHWPSYIEAAVNMVGLHTYINQVWLDEVGMDIPKTTDEFYEVLKAFKEKYPDKVAAIGCRGFRSDLIEWITNAFIYNYNDYFWNVENGKLYAPYNTDEYREALIYCKKLVDEDLIDELTLTCTEPGELHAYTTPSGAEGSNVGVFSGHGSLAAEANNEILFDFVPLTTLDSGNGKGGNVVLRTHTYNAGAGITSFCENVDKAVEVLDFMSSYEMSITKQRGPRGEYWDWVDGGNSNTGAPATYECWDASLWMNQNNKIWNMDNCTVSTLNGNALLLEDDGSFGYKKESLYIDLLTQALAADTPDEVVKELIYTAEEDEVVSEVKTVLQDYVRSQSMLFISGQIDPSNDADWETFCKDLELQGLSKWQEVAQAAYTRMNG